MQLHAGMNCDASIHVGILHGEQRFMKSMFLFCRISRHLTYSLYQDSYAHCSQLHRIHEEMAAVTICVDITGENIEDVDILW